MIRALQERGVHIWYDSGIYAGTLYNDVISEHMKNCALPISLKRRMTA